MSWPDWLRFRSKPPSTPAASPHTTERWVVLDVETSGLDTRHAQLLTIACISVHIDWSRRQLAIVPGDSLELAIKPELPVTDKANILLHGLGLERQSQGMPCAPALQLFIDYAGSSPLLAFHAGFDQSILDRHLQSHLHHRLPNEWLDIEKLCTATHPRVQAHTLDEWIAHFGIRCAARHQAVADTWSECELLQRIWPQVARQCASWRDVQRLAQHRRWLV
jgi:DNA polymerase III subunit epsilon